MSWVCIVLSIGSHWDLIMAVAPPAATEPASNVSNSPFAGSACIPLLASEYDGRYNTKSGNYSNTIPIIAPVSRPPPPPLTLPGLGVLEGEIGVVAGAVGTVVVSDAVLDDCVLVPAVALVVMLDTPLDIVGGVVEGLGSVFEEDGALFGLVAETSRR